MTKVAFLSFLKISVIGCPEASRGTSQPLLLNISAKAAPVVAEFLSPEPCKPTTTPIPRSMFRSWPLTEQISPMRFWPQVASIQVNPLRSNRNNVGVKL